MNLIPYRIKRRFTQYAIVRYLEKENVCFLDIPLFSGDWPRINNEGKISIGSSCHFRSFRLRQNIAVRKNAELIIGHSAFLNDGVNICATQSITIGENAKIGDMTYIYDTDFHEISPDMPTKRAPVSIGKNVWIGAQALILAGAVIGDHSVVAARSVVTGEFPSKSLIAGAPAKVVRTLDVPDSWIRK